MTRITVAALLDLADPEIRPRLVEMLAIAA